MIDDPTFDRAVEDAVKRIEAKTDAEIIVVLAPRSGDYFDVQAALGALVTLAALGVMFVAPVAIPPWVALLEVAVLFPLASWLFGHPAVLRALVPVGRQQAQVRTYAQAEFVREAVHGTPNHSGVLVYVSALERRVDVIADLAVHGKVPPAAWNTVLERLHAGTVTDFVASLDRLGEVLAVHVPHTEHSDTTNLPDAPRRRS